MSTGRDSFVFRIEKFYKDPNKDQKVVSLVPNYLVTVVRSTGEIDQTKEGIESRRKERNLVLFVSERIEQLEVDIQYVADSLKGMGERRLRREGLEPSEHFVDISHVNLKQISPTEFLTLPRVLNKRYHGATDNTEYIGRPSGYGNPFSHLDDRDSEFKVESREEAVKMFENYFMHLSEEDQEEFRNDLRGKDLMCWCVGGKKLVPCHGHVLLQLCN